MAAPENNAHIIARVVGGWRDALDEWRYQQEVQRGRQYQRAAQQIAQREHQKLVAQHKQATASTFADL